MKTYKQLCNALINNFLCASLAHYVFYTIDNKTRQVVEHKTHIDNIHGYLVKVFSKNKYIFLTREEAEEFYEEFPDNDEEY